MERSRFAVFETPYCVWEHDLRQRNIEFLDSIDPSYYQYVAECHAGDEEGPNAQHAAVALRTAYGQASETLFAFLAAAIQAPDCVVGWLQKYWPKDLRQVVERIDSSGPLLSKWQGSRLDWETLSEQIHKALVLDDAEKTSQIKLGFAKFWRRVAQDYLDDGATTEFNNIKHGLRIRSGGFALAIGVERTYGVACPPEEMQSIGGSVFGASFFAAEQVGQSRRGFRVRRVVRNWAPKNFAIRLHLLAMSINNTVAFLKICSGVPATTVQFRWPDDLDVFVGKTEHSVPVRSFNVDTVIPAQLSEELDADGILSVYPGAHETLTASREWAEARSRRSRRHR